MEPNSAMHHGVTANARQVESADLRSRVSRGVPLNAGSGHAIGVCMVPPTAVFDELMTATAPSASADGSSQPTSVWDVAPTAADVASVTGLMSVKENSHQPTEMAPRTIATTYIISRLAMPLKTALKVSRRPVS